eukprot:CAMPEP_0182444210 /NCGR_PEP_ID=MMETSP1172-20130603/2742_1 /TAXON_ID=708627 /ORGANISM="Timspurckia oligopyrenoides, Strain CCMP3278" /LENGTH=146 /DNA_ID=CAMNT_0024639725 /DNA_START=45 /DNA_END=485 /DNA_ORIENTATION=+
MNVSTAEFASNANDAEEQNYSDPGHPVHTLRQVTIEVGTERTSTSILIQAFSDHILLLVSQTGKLGTIVRADHDSVGERGDTFSVETLLGIRDDDWIELLARQVIQDMASRGTDLSLVLCVSLTRAGHEDRAIRDILGHVLANRIW